MKSHNSIVNLQKLTPNNPNLDLVKDKHMQFDQIPQIFVHKILSILTRTKSHNCVICKNYLCVAYIKKLTHNDPSLELVSVCAYAKFGPIQLICSQDTEQKSNFDKNQGLLLICRK